MLIVNTEIREPVKYCLADFVRQRGTSPPSPSFASKMIILMAHSPLPTVMMMVMIVTGMVLLLLPPTIGTVIVVMLIQGLRGGQSLPASLGGLVRVLLINQPNLSKLSDVP